MDFEEKQSERPRFMTEKIIHVRVDDVVLPNGKTAKRELISHGGGVGLLAVKDNGEVLMVEQFRIAAKSKMLEIPAGKLENTRSRVLLSAESVSLLRKQDIKRKDTVSR